MAVCSLVATSAFEETFLFFFGVSSESDAVVKVLDCAGRFDFKSFCFFFGVSSGLDAVEVLGFAGPFDSDDCFLGELLLRGCEIAPL